MLWKGFDDDDEEEEDEDDDGGANGFGNGEFSEGDEEFRLVYVGLIIPLILLTRMLFPNVVVVRGRDGWIKHSLMTLKS